jgi:glycosyltransferase involved in cell wall biosynthesis
MGRIMSISNVGLVHLENEPLFRITIPSKTQAYFREGLPVLMAVEGDARSLVQKAGAGLGCTPCDATAIAETLAQMAKLPPETLRQMGQSGQDFYQREMSFAVGMARLDESLRRIHAAKCWPHMDRR